MKYNDWLTEEVIKLLSEATLTPDQAGTSTRHGPHGTGASIYGDEIDPFQTDGEKESKNKHYRLEEAPGKKEIKLTWDTLPQPSVTELQWADPTSAERAELERFLNKVAPGKNLGEKLMKIQEVIENGFSKKTAMSTVLSYLVFLKTLTYIITSFNSASAGFTFESFLGVLLGGEQIPTGEDTIADYKTGEGEYVSLKLLGVKGSEGTDSMSSIDGSYTQLIDDLSGKNAKGTAIDSGGKMKYVIALKDLQGKGDTLGGTITVYEFTISRKNLADLMELTPKSRAAFSLMDEESRDLWTDEDYKYEFEDWLERRFVQPSQSTQGIDEGIIDSIIRGALPNPVTSLSRQKANDRLGYLQSLLAELDLGQLADKVQEKYQTANPQNDKDRAAVINDISKDLSEQLGGAMTKYVVKQAWDTITSSKEMEKWLNKTAPQRKRAKKPKSTDAWGRNAILDAGPAEQIKKAAIAAWNADTEDFQTKAKSVEKKKPQLKPMSFEDSKAELAAIKSDQEYYEHIKKYSMGYNSKGEPQFQIAQPHVTGTKKSKAVAGTGKPIGRLTVGRESVEKALEKAVNDTNEKMFEAFNKLRNLSTNLQDFFLNGLRSNDGENAIASTRGIAKDTGDIMKQKSKK